MNIFVRTILAIIILISILSGVNFLIAEEGEEDTEFKILDSTIAQGSSEDKEKVFINRSTLLNIPFTSQAPFGNWADLRQEDGCEEASVLMIMSWIDKWDLAPEKAEQEIIAISEYEQTLFGEFRETSLQDTANRILRSYFGYDNFEIRYGIDAKDIKSELYKGNAVIVAVNGQILLNPFYTPPGPRDHMIVIQGYDHDTKEFITNDPGTRHGEGFRYTEDLLIQSLQDYPTGNHESIAGIVKGMIVIKNQI